MARRVLAYRVMHGFSKSGEARTKGPKLPVWHYWAYWGGVLCALAAALTAFGVIRWPAQQTRSQKYYSAAAGGAHQLRFNLSTQTSLPERRLYPYSVIPGGVEDAQELRNAVANDPLVAALYANFDLSRAHIVRLARDQEVYVSYRMGGRIYWTRKRLLLHAGETVITDGSHEARTRCGNRVSEAPMQPVAPNEPPDAAVNNPATPVLVAENSSLPLLPPLDPSSSDPANPGFPMFPGPPSTPPVNAIPPPIFPIVGGGPPSFPDVIPPPQPPPVSTPEPGALPLLAIGLLAFAAVWIFRSAVHPKA